MVFFFSYFSCYSFFLFLIIHKYLEVIYYESHVTIKIRFPSFKCQTLVILSSFSSMVTHSSSISYSYNFPKRVCVSIVVKSLYSHIAVTLGCQLQFRHIRIFMTNSSFENFLPKVLIWFVIRVNHVFIWLMFSSCFILKSSYSWVNVPNLALFTSVVPSWVIWRVSYISLAVS